MSAGREFVGNYRMFHLIRAGAMFEIWAVRPMAETTAYAMKGLPPGSRYDRSTVAQLKHEYDVGKALDHPSIIKTYDYGPNPEGSPFLARSLQDALAGVIKRMTISTPTIQ